MKTTAILYTGRGSSNTTLVYQMRIQRGGGGGRGYGPTWKITSGYKTLENLVGTSLEKQLAPRGRSLAKGNRDRDSFASRGWYGAGSPRARDPIAFEGGLG